MLKWLTAWLHPSDTNLNQVMKRRQTRWGFLILALLVLATLGLWLLVFFSGEKPSRSQPVLHKATVDGVVSSDYTAKNELSALEQQQAELNQLQKRLVVLTKQLAAQQTPKQARQQLAAKINALIDQRLNTPSPIKQGTPSHMIAMNHDPFQAQTVQRDPMHSIQAMQPPIRSLRQRVPEAMETVSFRYAKPALPPMPHVPAKNPNNYVPAGTFARGILLEGADANASVNGQSSTSPILVRLLDPGTLPNGRHSHLKGCFVLASMYGDISSERGEARLTRLSCTFNDGSILERNVQGHIAFAGKEGIKGTPVMRNDKILMMAGLSGGLSGIGSALQQGLQTQSVSPLGVTTTVSPSQVFQHGAYGGASTALGQLAHYYINRAEQYHPVIEIGSGTIGTVIFQRGFSLVDEVTNTTHPTLKSPSAVPIHSAADRRALQLMMQHMQPMAQQATDQPVRSMSNPMSKEIR